MTSFFLDQHGCAKNQIDGELILTRLLKKGMKRVDSPEEADLIIVNSCGFIESAKRESLEAVIDAKTSYPKAKVLLAGCLSERYAETLAEDLPEADGIIGNGDLSAIDAVVDSMTEGSRPVEIYDQQGVCCGEREELLSFPGSAYVKITEGCDNRCSFCAIPLIRGTMRSRPAQDIIDEIKSLVARGIVEINLVGQDSAAFGMDGAHPHKKEIWSQFDGTGTKLSPLAQLLQGISRLEGKFWLRLLYIHPDHFPLDILPVMAQDSRLLPYFDIPFQSGCDPIIKAMNRTGTGAEYTQLVQSIRSRLHSTKLGEPALRTTFLVGFPGETDDHAQQTLDFIKGIQPDWAGSFTYSREDDTPAAAMKNQVPKKVAEKRNKVLQQLQEEITSERLRQRVDRTYDVLIEEVIEGGDGEGNGLAIGRCWFQAPEVDGAVVVSYDLEEQSHLVASGRMVPVLVTGTSGVDLTGAVV